MDMTTALTEMDAWPIDERLEFVQRAWDRIVDSGWQPTLTDEQKAEFDRRLNDVDANPECVVSWEEIVQHVDPQRWQLRG